MIKQFLQKQFINNKALIIKESGYVQNFMQLIMKQRNTGVKWTKEEKRELKSNLKHLSLYVPLLIIFALPFGSFVLPLLTEIMERRNKEREK
ncbi:MAG: hypothetical protein EHM30_05910 [Desulfobacteraceae bacterium]|nr:MAG: hypothetical protein EHM30_05910 [Desulfobacteraceae bacterium]